jgi:alanyl-tRNA synthetase
VAAREEGRFRATLRSGLTMLEAELAGGAGEVSGEVAFRLHDTHGFPVELTREIASERGATVDEAGFAAAMKRQQEQSGLGKKGPGADDGDRLETYRKLLDEGGPTRFVGYADTTVTATVLAVLAGDAIDGSQQGQVEIFLDATPFYAEGGGQVGDTGVIETDTGRARVVDTTAALPGLVRHLAVIEDGELRAGQAATAAIDADRRAAIRRNHTGTHLLHWALRTVLGEHVKQQGSLVAPDRLRFDFTHYGPVTTEEREQIEDLANEQVLADPDVTVELMRKTDADQAGAIAFFDEKYGDEVRVVQAGPLSLELCGGTHVDRLGQIGPIEIVSEGSIGSNLRRIEATTGTVTLSRLRQAEHQIAEAADLLRATPDSLSAAVARKVEELRALEQELRSVKQAGLAVQARDLVASAVDGQLVVRVDGLDGNELRELAAQARQAGNLRLVVLGGSPDGAKVSLVALVAAESPVTAPDLIGPAAKKVGGGGGGRNPEQAMAGGRDASRLDEALDDIRRQIGL